MQTSNTPLDQPILTGADVLKLVDQLLTFPFAQICIHSVAASLLDSIERCGVDVGEDLADAVVRAHDDTARALIADRLGS